MAESAGDKTEAPTPRRRQEAREQGQVARSPDLTAAAVLVGILLLLKAFGPALVGSLRTLVADMLGPRSIGDFSSAAVGSQILRAVVMTGIAMAPLLIGVVIVAVVANVAQVGLVLNPEKLQPNLEALNPIRGIGKIFGGGQSLVLLLMNLLKVTLVGLTAYSAVHGRLLQIVTVQQLTFIQIFGLGAEIVYAIALRIAILLLVLAIVDYAWQRFRNERELRMTKQEVKEEMKRMEGDPQIKQRRRQIAIQTAMRKLKKDVPKADVVVTNPTHFAIALQYDSATMHAPKVLAKGQDFMALRIRQLAIEAGVPIIERPPLARAMYKMVDVGQEVPEQFYSAIAEILAYVYELSGKARQKVAV